MSLPSPSLPLSPYYLSLSLPSTSLPLPPPPLSPSTGDEETAAMQHLSGSQHRAPLTCLPALLAAMTSLLWLMTS